MSKKEAATQPIKASAASRDRSNVHPSRSLEPRQRGYGIGGGYERPYRQRGAQPENLRESYGPLPHSGYYGSGAGSVRFEIGQAGFKLELPWYAAQYGARTSGEKERG